MHPFFALVNVASLFLVAMLLAGEELAAEKIFQI